MPGPLEGFRVVELGGIGPAPFCGMVLGDLGAEVIRISRVSDVHPHFNNPVLDRGRRQIAVDLKSTTGVDLVKRLIASSDAVIEGFRPGVMERLGFVSDELRQANPRLVVGRMTGYGQDGPMSQEAGHDINYISQAGVLGSIGRAGDKPVAPLNLVGDFGGGGMLLAVGVLAGILSASKTGKGQDIDAAMVDGAALLMAMMYGFSAQGRWNGSDRGHNLFDGGMPFYDTYETADGKYVAVGAIEPQFYKALVEGLGLNDVLDLKTQNDQSTWPSIAKVLTDTFKTRTRDEWAAELSGKDTCVTAIYSMDEAPTSPHVTARGVFLTDEAGVTHPAPAPRFSGTPLAKPTKPHDPAADTDLVLADLGLDADEIKQLHADGVIA